MRAISVGVATHSPVGLHTGSLMEQPTELVG